MQSHRVSFRPEDLALGNFREHPPEDVSSPCLYVTRVGKLQSPGESPALCMKRSFSGATLARAAYANRINYFPGGGRLRSKERPFLSRISRKRAACVRVFALVEDRWRRTCGATPYCRDTRGSANIARRNYTPRDIANIRTRGRGLARQDEDEDDEAKRSEGPRVRLTRPVAFITASPGIIRILIEQVVCPVSTD